MMNRAASYSAGAPADMAPLLAWLDARKRPVFVELPLAQYRQLQGAWNLPAIATQEQAR